MSPSTTRIIAFCIILLSTFHVRDGVAIAYLRYFFAAAGCLVIYVVTVAEESANKKPGIYDPKGLSRWREEWNKEGGE